jgi:hypothetical protein
VLSRSDSINISRKPYNQKELAKRNLVVSGRDTTKGRVASENMAYTSYISGNKNDYDETDRLMGSQRMRKIPSAHRNKKIEPQNDLFYFILAPNE